MARTRKVSDRRPPEKSPIVVSIEDSRRLVTIGTDAAVWGDRQAVLPIERGCLVRIEPPASVADADVEHVQLRCELAGAAAVVVLPRRKAAVVVKPKERKPHARGRELVHRMVEESNFDDKADLHEFVENIMARVGLG